VDSDEAARQLVATQDHNPLLEMDTLPFDSSYEAARASHGERPDRPTVM
jgi:MHS family proline/betaine transporter-like MFS transporter